MLQRLRHTWIALALACLAVVGSGALIIRSFVGYVGVDCRGTLQRVSERELGDDPEGGLPPIPWTTHDLEVRHEERWPNRYDNVRVVWTRPEVKNTCADVTVPWSSKKHTGVPSLTLHRDEPTGLYLVLGGDETVVFRKIDDEGTRLEWGRVLDVHNLSMLIFLVSLAALGVGGALAMRATPYATRMHAWRSGTQREDGVVEDHGTILGRVDPRARIPAGPVIVDPAVSEGRDIYREVPVLGRRTVGAGSHERWTAGTLRRIRDARSLAILSTATTLAALAARMFA